MPFTKENKQRDQYKFYRDPYRILGIPLFILFLLFSLLSIRIIIDLRTQELKINLQNLDDRQDVGRSLSLLLRYRILSDRFTKGESSNDTDDSLSEIKKESVLLTIQSSQKDTTLLQLTSFDWMKLPVISFINFLSFLFGTKSIQGEFNDLGGSLLEVGNKYEIQRKYNEARYAYETASNYFRENNLNEKLAYSELHRAFCISLIGKIEDAIKIYSTIITSDIERDLILTAIELRKLLFEIVRRTKKADKIEDPVSRGESLFRLAKYQDAIDLFNKIEGTSTEEKKPKLYYFRGRSYEEIGYIDNALNDYRKVIKEYSFTIWSKRANKRIFVNGVLYSNKEDIKEEAKKLAIELQDTAFLDQVEKISISINHDDLLKPISNSKNTIKALKKINKETNINLEIPILKKKSFFFKLRKKDEKEPLVEEKNPLEEEENKHLVEKEKKRILESHKKNAIKLKRKGDEASKKEKYSLAINIFKKGEKKYKEFYDWNALIVTAKKYHNVQVKKLKKQQKQEEKEKYLKELVTKKEKAKNMLKDNNELISIKSREDALVELLVQKEPVYIIFLKNGKRIPGYILNEYDHSMELATVKKTILIKKKNIVAKILTTSIEEFRDSAK